VEEVEDAEIDGEMRRVGRWCKESRYYSNGVAITSIGQHEGAATAARGTFALGGKLSALVATEARAREHFLCEHGDDTLCSLNPPSFGSLRRHYDTAFPLCFDFFA
jgi:hypothetical protein